ncbi:MAG: TIM-barrel domain-containing protein, partial [Hominenteromicrobium sp.]
GYPVALHCVDDTIHYDATNPEAREFVWNEVKKNYYDKGVRIFWLDEAEPEYSYYDFDNYRYHLGPNVQIGNIYPKCYAQTFYEGMEQAGQKNILNLLRCAWAGSQKYGALVWSGDIHSSFESFRNQFAAGLNMGIAGIPWWTTDIGGFHGGDPNDEAFREVFARWFQYGTFCPVMRLHGDREPHALPLSPANGGRMPSGGPNEVWSYGETIYEMCSKYMFLRERLRPYITGLMRDAHEKGSPVIRPMFYDFPQDGVCWENDTQYMFGGSLLVAPVMEAGQRKKNVYLPEGTWYNAWTGEALTGGRVIEADAPLDVIPVFTRDPALLEVFRG